MYSLAAEVKHTSHYLPHSALLMMMDLAADSQINVAKKALLYCAARRIAAAAASAGVVNAGAATDKRAADAKARVHITPSEPKVDAACRSRCVALGRATRVAPAAQLLRQRQRQRLRQHQALSRSLMSCSAGATCV